MRWRAFVVAVVASLAGGVMLAPPAAAAPKIFISQAKGLDASGQQVTVSGRGYDESKGIYVALCRDNGPGQKPTPCIGGVDTTGGSGSSVWVTSKPPPYAEGLTVPFEPGGSFTVSIQVKAKDANTDCTKVACVIATRADHRYPSDTSQLARIPVTFEQAAAPKPTKKPKPTKSAKPTASSKPTKRPATTRPTASSEPRATSAGDQQSAVPSPAAVAATPQTPPSGAPATDVATTAASTEPEPATTDLPAGDEASTPPAAADIDTSAVSDTSDSESSLPWAVGAVLVLVGIGAATVALRGLRTRRSGPGAG